MSTELARLASGPARDERPNGSIATLSVLCDEGASDVLVRAKQVLELVLRQAKPAALSMEQWREALPAWFVRQCADEISPEEAQRRRLLPFEQRLEFAKQWSLGGWLYWFDPEERPWEWWDSQVVDDRRLTVDLIVSGFPYPSGAIEWLFRCSGAKEIESWQRPGSECAI
jgi:hypothetical protein